MDSQSNASSNSPQPDLPSQLPSNLSTKTQSNLKTNFITSQTHSSIPWIIVFVLVGCLLRLVWADDMKWKADEIWMYETARDVVTGKQPWPWLGMANGVGFLNPGLSVWCFIALAWVTDDPVSMVRWVQGSNIVAIGLFIGFIVRFIPKSEQLIWLWGLTILSVNPLAIHFSRAIWSVDILLFFAFFVFVGHWFRGLRSGAFIWGLLGTLIGQIHMSGFFWQASLVLVSFWQQFKYQSKLQLEDQPKDQPQHSTQHSTRWLPWALGSAIGLLPMIPWIRQIGGTAATIARPSWAELLTPNFPLHWLLSSWGLNLEYDLGPEFWRSFLLEPRIMGYPSFGVAVALLFLAISAIAAIVRWWHRWQRQRQSSQQYLNNSIVERNSNLYRNLKQEPAPNAYMSYLWAGGVVMPILLLFARVRIPGHYLIILYPFIHIWVAVLEHSRVRSLILICSAQLFLSICFLLFIHIHNGGPEAFYGTVYRLQHSR